MSTPHTLHVCITCRRAGAPTDQPRDGLALFGQVAALHADWPLRDRVAVKPIECQSGCDRACTIGLAGQGKPSYLFGDKLPTQETAAAALDLAALYLNSPDGALPRGERPALFRSGILARIPTP